MKGINKVTLVGFVGKDPEYRNLKGGAATNFTVGTNDIWKDKITGEKKEVTEWHQIVTYKSVAEHAKTYLKKGSNIYLEGRLRTRKHIDKHTGLERHTTEIIVNEFRLLDGQNKHNINNNFNSDDDINYNCDDAEKKDSFGNM